MRNPTASLFPVLTALFALGVLGMPDGVAAQEGTGCVKCERSNEEPPACVPLVEPAPALGWHTCEVEVGQWTCTLSRRWPDCVVYPPWLDGRVDMGPPVANGSVGATELPRSGQVVVSGVATPVAVERSACTSAIVQRRYPPARIAELRAHLRHVTV